MGIGLFSSMIYLEHPIRMMIFHSEVGFPEGSLHNKQKWAILNFREPGCRSHRSPVLVRQITAVREAGERSGIFWQIFSNGKIKWRSTISEQITSGIYDVSWCFIIASSLFTRGFSHPCRWLQGEANKKLAGGCRWALDTAAMWWWQGPALLVAGDRWSRSSAESCVV